MANLRTTDTNYGEDYWTSLDDGAGYNDSMMWANISCAIKEVYGYDWTNRVDISSKINILDMGCASGYSVRWLRRQGFDTWGTDFSEYALEHAPDDVKEYIRYHDLTMPNETHFGTEAFALVTCFETLEHIPEEHTSQALQHIYDVLKPGGVAVVTICTEDQPGWETDPTHITIKPTSWWADKFREIGFIAGPGYERLTNFWFFHFHHGVFIVQKPLL